MLSGVLIVTEAAVGAGLVLFQLVADNATMARAMFVAVHLLNTFLLLGALTLTAWWVSVGRPVRRPAGRRQAATLAAACAALLVAGASGAVAALGDTLFPSASLSDALWADLSADVAFPDPAAGPAPGARGRRRPGRARSAPAAWPAAARPPSAARRADRDGAGRSRRSGSGLLNVILLAPVWLQLAHLLVADAHLDRRRAARRPGLPLDSARGQPVGGGSEGGVTGPFPIPLSAYPPPPPTDSWRRWRRASSSSRST